LVQSSIVLIIGPQCAGKSTVAATLCSLFEEVGLRARPVNLAGFYDMAKPAWPLIFDVAKLLTRRPSNMSSTMTLQSLLEDSPRLFRGLLKLWLLLDTFSVYARFLLEVYIPSKLGYSVIVELGWPNWVAFYVYLYRLLRLPSDAMSRWTDLVQRLILQINPTRTIFLDAETSVLEARWRQRPGVQRWTTIAELRELQRTIALSLVRVSYKDVVRLDSTSRETLTSRELQKAVSDLLAKSKRSKQTGCSGR
jgi:thymidylate kinase